MSRVRVEFKETANGEHMFHIYGQNGEHQGMGESYTRGRDAKRGLDDMFVSLLIHYFRESRLDDMLRKAGISLSWIGDTEQQPVDEMAANNSVGDIKC